MVERKAPVTGTAALKQVRKAAKRDKHDTHTNIRPKNVDLDATRGHDEEAQTGKSAMIMRILQSEGLEQQRQGKEDELERRGNIMSERMSQAASGFEVSFTAACTPDRLPPGRQRKQEKRLGMTLNLLGQRLHDFTNLKTKPDHENRPLWIDPQKAMIILERFHPLAEQATDLLIAIAEPKSRPAFMHEYALTPHSLYAAVAVGLSSEDIIQNLDRLLKVEMPDSIAKFIKGCSASYGKVKLVLRHNRYFVECADAVTFRALANDTVIKRVKLDSSSSVQRQSEIVVSGTADAAGVKQVDGPRPLQPITKSTSDLYAALADADGDDESHTVFSFELPTSAVQEVQQRCLELSYPILEEYDFRNDEHNVDLDIDLRPMAQIRPYQERALSKMFNNGRAKSGIIVLPCGAGKTLVGITAACTVKKGTIVLCTSAVSAVQWRKEFLKWSNINPEDITTFTADNKIEFPGATGIIVTTYSMVAYSGQRSAESARIMDFLHSREWGFMILDEVHVAPANLFRRVISTIKSHAKLGLTATLLREDDKINHLNFLIGPKLYEANWMELSQKGYIAKVQCAEVWCDMPPDFYTQYLRQPSKVQRTLGAVNPRKFQACQYLINYHEARGDKILIFSDELYALKLFAIKMNKPYIYGDTGDRERQDWLDAFRESDKVNTLFLSKIGDTSLDLPEATVLIQISSHFGSRRQEAQRLGRVLRAKRRSDEGFNAYFYSLVSKDTQEQVYSWNRQKFLVAQGYAFKVITKFKQLETMPGLGFKTRAEQMILLKRSLEDAGVKPIKYGHLGKEQSARSIHDVAAVVGNLHKRKAVADQLNDILPGADMTNSSAPPTAIKPPRKKAKNAESSSNPFFKQLTREKENRKKRAVQIEKDEAFAKEENEKKSAARREASRPFALPNVLTRRASLLQEVKKTRESIDAQALGQELDSLLG